MGRTKESQSEIGMLYQYGVTTLLAAELSENDKVEDYVIYSSENSAGKFDDVVARIKLKDEDDWYLFLIQVKYKETKKLNVSDTLKGKRVEHFLSDYIQSFNEILTNPELTCRQGIPSDNIRFAIFCDKAIQMPVFLRQDCTFELEVCSYSEENEISDNLALPFSGRCWKFVCKDLENSEHQVFFDRCCLFLEQPNYSKLNQKIQEICAVYSPKDIVNYVKDYFNIDELYVEGLSKEVFEIELQKIRLFEAIPHLMSAENFADDAPIDIWNKIILEHDITALNCAQDFAIEHCIYSCLLHKVNTLLNINIDWENYTSIKNSLDNEIIQKFIEYSRSKRRYWIDPPNSLRWLIIELWKCGDLPLILKTSINLKDFERYAHLNRSYVIIDNWTHRSEELSGSKLKIFYCLNSITNRELQGQILTDTFVSLQGRKAITLKDLLHDDKELLSTFTSADLLGILRKRTAFLREDYYKGSNYLAFVMEDDECTDVSDRIEPYAIGHNVTVSCPSDRINEAVKIIRGHADTSRNYTIYHLRRDHGKLILSEGDPEKLSHRFVDQYGDPLFASTDRKCIPIIGQYTELNELQYIRRRLRRATISRSYLRSEDTRICFLSGEVDFIGWKIEFSQVEEIAEEKISTEKKTYFLRIDEERNRQDYWRQLSKLGYPIFDVYVEDGRLDLLRFQHCKDLSLDISYDGGICSEDEFLNEIRNEAVEIAIITGDAGIGKTSLLKWLCNNYSTDDYIIFYDLINLQVDLSRCEYQKTDPIDFIFEAIRKSVPKKYITIVSSLLQRKRLVWVLDSFDEIRLACEKQVLDFLQLIVRTGAQIIVATRIENCDILMNQFGIRLIKIEPLEENESSLYWQLSEDLLGNVSPELAANPLYLNFLKMISVNREQLSNITKFTLYEKVINMNIRRCLQRTYRVLYDSEVERTVSLFERLALVTMFGKEMVERELYWTIDKEVADMTKFGIISRFNEGDYPIFYHRSFVEFLVAQWMTKACKIYVYKNAAKFFYKQIFDENKLHYFNILFEDIDLHKAIFERNVSRMKYLQCWDIVDKLGRTALHTAVIVCGYANNLLTYQTLEFVITTMLKAGYDVDKRDSIMDWDWSEYVRSEMFDTGCSLGTTAFMKLYLQFHRRNIENSNSLTAIFPTKYFNKLFRTAIEFTSIDMIGDLVFLQNLENKTFRSFYQACLGIVAERAPTWTKDIQFEGRLTLLHTACIYGSISMIQNLIKLGVDVNAVDDIPCMPLYYSIMRRAGESAVKLLLDAGAAPNFWIMPKTGVSSLCLAIQIMNVNVVKMLLEAGADTSHDCISKDTPLHFAVRAGNMDIIRSLLDYKASPYSKNKRGETPIDIAVKQNRTDIVELLREEREYLIQHTTVNIGLRGTALHDAAYSGDISLLRQLLRENEDINLRNRDGYTPLHVAMHMKNTGVITFLLENGADVNAQDTYGGTPLCIATQCDDLEVMEMFLEEGANVNVAIAMKQTPLFDAVLNESVNAVKLLLSKGATVNAQIPTEETPLCVAVKCGNEDIVALLLENGADMEIPDEEGDTPLHTSIRSEYIKISELLLEKGARPNVRNKSGETPLFCAAYVKSIDSVRLLLGKDARIDDENLDGNTALHIAALFGSEDITRLLLENGANINALSRNGNSVLLYAAISKQMRIVTLLLEAKINIDRKGGIRALALAAMEGDINTVRLLLSRGVSVNGCLEGGYTPLHLAASTGHEVVVNFLLKNGAHINATAEFGFTPLHDAVKGRHDNIVRLLIENGADLNATCTNGSTILLCAIASTNVNIVELLLRSNVNTNRETDFKTLIFAVSIGAVDIIKLLLNKEDINLNIHSEYGYTLLYIATITKRTDIMELLLPENETDVTTQPFLSSLKDADIKQTSLLLDKGAIVDAFFGGRTALHLKIAEGNADFVKFLIERGADVNLRTDEDETPLQIAVDCQHTEIVKLLLDRNADLNALTSNKESILKLAARKRNTELMMELLLNKDVRMITDTANGTTLLHDCARDGNVDILNLLLDKKVDLNVQDNFGQTALHIGALEGSADIVGLLLEAGANADVRNYNGETAFNVAVRKIYTNPANLYPKTLKDYCESLSISIEEPNAEITWLLLKYTKININDVDMVRAFHWAVNKRHLNIVTLLLHRGMNVNVQYQHRYTALHVALNNNDNDLVEILLDEGADPNIFSPLSFAVSKENVNAVKLLLKRGANLQDRGGIFGSTNFLRAIHGGNKDIVMALLENGADVEMANEEDQKPLHLSIWYQHKEITELLLRHGANVNVQARGYTPFMFAVLKDDIDTMHILLKKGARVNDKTIDDDTALHMGVTLGNENVVKLLLERGADLSAQNKRGDSILHLATRSKRLHIIPLLLRANVKIDRIGGAETLMFVVSVGDINTVRMLLNKKVNVNIYDSRGWTPLHIAADKGHTLIVDLLIQQGARVNSTTKTGSTPLHYAVWGRYENMIKLLINKGADITAKCKDGWTALLVAITTKDVNIVELLLQHVNTDRIVMTALRCAVSLQLESKDENVDIVCLLFKYMKEINVNDKDVIGIFYWAAINGYLQIIKLLLNSGMNVNVQDQHGYTALHRAVSHKNYDVVEYLLENGAYIPPETNSER